MNAVSSFAMALYLQNIGAGLTATDEDAFDTQLWSVVAGGNDTIAVRPATGQLYQVCWQSARGSGLGLESGLGLRGPVNIFDALFDFNALRCPPRWTLKA